MKKKILALIAAVMIAALSSIFAACFRQDSVIPPIDDEYSKPFTPEATDYIRNPDCGFYQPVSFSCKPDGIAYSLGTYLKRNNLLHLRLNLGAFQDSELSAQTTADLDKLLLELRENSINAVIRFAYDGFNGYKDKEPPMNLILRHIAQLGSVLTNYPDVLTAVEAGMIGPWGEMHSSAIAIKDNFNALIETWLRNTNNSTPVLVRRPKMVADYLGINVSELNEHKSVIGNDDYRLGIFNDGYLGSGNDLGTYVNREIEINWLNAQASHTPFGGEVTIPGSKYNKIEYASKEMFLTHTCYLNELWNDKVIAEWKNTLYNEENGVDASYYGKTAYEYIRDHLGYRFVISDIVLPKSAKNNFKISFNVYNSGFGNLLKSKTCEMLLVSNGKTSIVPLNIDPTKWLSGKTEKISLEIQQELTPGEYSLYLRVRDPSMIEPNYCVAFSNGAFSEELLANFIGKINVR